MRQTLAFFLPFLLSCGTPSPPADASDPNAIIAIAAGPGPTPSLCGVTRSGAVLCRLTNIYEAWSPVATGASSVIVSGAAGCSLNADRTLTCWRNASNTPGVRHFATFDSTLTDVSSPGIATSRGGYLDDFRACAIVGGTGWRCFNTLPTADGGAEASFGAFSDGSIHAVARTKVRLGYDFFATIQQNGAARLTVEGSGPVSVSNAVDANGVWLRYCVQLRSGENACGRHGANPVVVPTFTGLTNLLVTDDFVCGLASDRTVRCSGSNSYGQLGDGTTTDTTGDALVTPVGLGAVDSLVTNAGMTCALRGGDVMCWGAWVETLGGMPIPHTTPTRYSLTLSQ